jgi:phosphoribosylformylglycinamidine synthase
VVVSCANDKVAAITAAAKAAGIAATVLGTVTSGSVAVNGESWGSIESWKNLYDTAIEKLIN